MYSTFLIIREIQIFLVAPEANVSAESIRKVIFINENYQIDRMSLKSVEHLELFFRANDDAVISTHVGVSCTFVLNFKRCWKRHCIAVNNTYADDWSMVLQPNFFG